MNSLSDIYFTTESYLFSSAARGNWRNKWKNEGISADFGDNPSFPVPDQRPALVLTGPPDGRSGKDSSGVLPEVGLRLSDDEGAD